MQAMVGQVESTSAAPMPESGELDIGIGQQPHSLSGGLPVSFGPHDGRLYRPMDQDHLRRLLAID
jgi:hypothetical protein